jgi:ribosomal-protein-alanine N-acetyltransferase
MSLTLHTPRLLLRILSADDRAEYVRIHNQSHVHFAPWTPAPEPGITAEDLFVRHLEKTTRGLANDTDYRFVAVLGNGKIAGFFNLSNIIRGAFQNAYAGWGVSADATGHGYATEAVAGLLDLAFAPPPRGVGLHRVQANVIPTNAASLRVADKNGFRREGLAKAYLKIAGKWQDHLMLAKVAEEHAFRYLTPLQS